MTFDPAYFDPAYFDAGEEAEAPSGGARKAIRPVRRLPPQPVVMDPDTDEAYLGVI